MKKSIMLVCTGIMVLFLSGAGSWGLAPPAAQRVHAIDITMTREGYPVENLKKDDFRIYVDGKEVEILSMEMVPFANKLNIIFHDPTFWTREAASAKDQTLEMIMDFAKQGYELAVFQLDWTRGLTLVQPYSSDALLLEKACRKAVENTGIDATLTNMSGQTLSGEESAALRDWGERGELQAFMNIQRQRFEKAAGGLFTIGHLLKPENERTSILMVSCGFPDLASSSQLRILSENLGGREALDAIHSRDQQQSGRIRFFDPFQILKTDAFDRADQVLKELVGFINSQNLDIYALDPGTFSRSVSSRTSEFFSQSEAQLSRIRKESQLKEIQNLRFIAEKTDADFFRGADKFERLRATFATEESLVCRLRFSSRSRAADDKTHQIRIESSLRDMKIKSPESFTDYSPEKQAKLALISAYYNPDFFKAIRFDAGFVPFQDEDGKYAPWINVALPTKSLFKNAPALGDKKDFQVHFWIAHTEGHKEGYHGELRIPIAYNAALEDYIREKSHLWYFIRGRNLPFMPGTYKVTYALVDGTSQEIGTWVSRFSLPDVQKNPGDAAFINCVPGALVRRSEKKKTAVILDKKSGVIEYGEFRFMPLVHDRITPWEDVHLFLQVYMPSEPGPLDLEFIAENQSGFSEAISGEAVLRSFNARTKIWSAVFKLDTFKVFAGINTIEVKIPLPDGKGAISRKFKLIKTKE